jgi:hypothetical protein
MRAKWSAWGTFVVSFSIAGVGACGGGSSKGGAGGGQAGAGVGGRSGSGFAGAAEIGGAGGGGLGGSVANRDAGGSLPPCAITSRPQDPVDSIDGGYNDVHSHVCNSVDPSGPLVDVAAFTSGDAGAELDGGLSLPQGGTVLDGDYDLTHIFYVAATGETDRRTFRVFDGGTYIERGLLIQEPTGDSGTMDFWYDTTESPSGTDLGTESICGFEPTTELYTAEGDNLTLYVYYNSQLSGIEVYRRTCSRP